ncbi:fumarylacetoacetate hydrolase family protein [Nocardia beijingensis]|uniref:fumarylacetoacetate hydrolase family protein n=1 Tax=Nocardia beijingensis TaxID=95162 RepID=UPI00344FAA6B
MKLATYTGPSGPELGVVVEEEIISVSSHGLEGRRIDSMQDYLRDLPHNRKIVEEWASTKAGTGIALRDTKLLSPVQRPPMLLDCSVAPRHLWQGSTTMFARSLPRPIAAVARPFIGPISRRVLARRLDGEMLYYKGRTTSVVGTGATIPWPAYTAYLDIEPELAIVVGDIDLGASPEQVAARIGGYTILNDVSARDVQLREMMGTGLAATKDMENGNVLGPVLVTPDEFGDPLDRDVRVTTDLGRVWTGTTADYTHDPVDVVTAIAERQHLEAGTVIGMGTVADTCGLERDEWIEPGESIWIEIAGIGTLHQSIGFPAIAPPTRWQSRTGLAISPSQSASTGQLGNS